MRRRAVALSGSAVGILLIVAGCTTSSDGKGTPSAVATTTVTATGSASSAAPPTGSGVPATSTAPVGGSTGSATASGPGLCTPTVATFTVGPAEGAAGTGFLPVHVTNASQRSCVTTGYPGVALLNASGSQILQAQRETGYGQKSTTITLAPGEQATALIATSAQSDNGAACPTSPAFLFTLPDNTDSTKLTAVLSLCNVKVRPFVKGDGS